MNSSLFLRKAAAFMLALLLLALPVAALAQDAREAALSENESSEDIWSGEEAVDAERDDIDEPTRKMPPVNYDFSSIRVLITIGSTSYINLDLNGSYTIPGHSGTLTGTESNPYKIKVARSSSTVTITNRTTGATLASGSSVELLRVTEDYTAGWAKLTYCAESDTLNRMYLGSFRFLVKNSTLMMVNTVPMAYYIYGVTGYELNPYCEDEALYAQAIAAKCHALYYIDTSSTSTYDIPDGYNSAQYQAYRGFRENRLGTMPHCLAVVGVAMCWNNTFVPIAYGHTNGGESSLPSTIWGSSCSWYDGAYGVVLDDIEYNSEDEDKDVITVTFGGTGDNSRFRDFILKKVRDLYGVSATKVKSISELYTFNPLSGYQRHMQSLHVKAKVTTPSGDKTYTFECPTSHLRTLQLSDYDGSGDSYSTYKYCFKNKRLIYWGQSTSNGYKLIYSGHGHGVGLSQIGANIRANPDTYGWNYQQILHYYYPGMTIISITERAPGQTAPVDPPTPPVDPDGIVAYGECFYTHTNFRTGPSTSYPVIGQLVEGEHFDILDVTENGWFKARWNGHEGYITLTYTRVASFPAPANGVFMLMDGVTKNACNLRSEPYIRSGNVITVLPGGTRVTAWAHINKWYYVTTENGYQGFLSNVVTNYGEPYEYTGVAVMIKNYALPGGSDMPVLPDDPRYKRIGVG